MGVSVAVEDVAAIAETLSLKESTNRSLVEAMAIFEKVRKARAEAVSMASFHSANVLHLPAGAQRCSRNAAMISDGQSESYVNKKRFYAEGTRIDWRTREQETGATDTT